MNEVLCFFFNDTAPTEIYTLSLHDALPIWSHPGGRSRLCGRSCGAGPFRDRKSTRLNSSHGSISYAVFCFETKNTSASSAHESVPHHTIAPDNTTITHF